MQVKLFFIYLEKLIGETEMFGKNACVVVLFLKLLLLLLLLCRCNCMGDNKSLSEFVIICHR